MKLSKAQLGGIGVAALAAGLYFFAGPQIKNFFKKKNEENETGEVESGPLVPMPTLQPGKVAPTVTDTLNIDKKLKKGSSGEEVKRVQYIVNYIAGFRGATAYKTPSGYTVKFPIGQDGNFGSDTQAGVYFAFDTFKTNGYITLDIARQKLAYIAGYYDKPFPSELAGTKNYNKYQTSYKAGQIDGSKNVNLTFFPTNLIGQN